MAALLGPVVAVLAILLLVAVTVVVLKPSGCGHDESAVSSVLALVLGGLKVFLGVFLGVHLFFLSGRCARCGENVVGEGTGCTAMDQVFHVDCFTCIICNNKLRGQPFYAVEKKAYCEPCYIVSSHLLCCFAEMSSLAKCQSHQIEYSQQIFISPPISKCVCVCVCV